MGVDGVAHDLDGLHVLARDAKTATRWPSVRSISMAYAMRGATLCAGMTASKACRPGGALERRLLDPIAGRETSTARYQIGLSIGAAIAAARPRAPS